VADLNGDERGQILLVAAFALAVIFVSMALIVNSAIFTENLASRGETAGSDRALSMRATVETNVGEGIAAANRNNNSSPTELVDATRADIRTLSRQTGRQAARSGRVVDVTYQSNRPGVRIAQTDGSALTTGGGVTDYRVVGGVSRVDGANGTRAFEIAASDITATDNASAFEVSVQRTGATGNENSWRARIYRTGAETVHIRTLRNNSTSTLVEDCEVTRDSGLSTFRIDLTGGTVDGEPCDALGTAPSGANVHFGAGTDVTPGGTDTYDIEFANADQVTGNFSMVVYRRPSTTLDLSSIGTSPTSTTALYDVTVRYTHLTTDLRYETDLRVAPGEPDV